MSPYLISSNSEMRIIQALLFSLGIFAMIVVFSQPTELHKYLAQTSPNKTSYRLSKPLIGDDGRIYACSENNLFAFQSNGSIAWSLHLDYKCNILTGPVRGGRGSIFLVAEDRVLKVNFQSNGTSGSAAEVFFGPGQEGPTEIIGVAISTISSSVFINVKNRGLFAYSMHGELLWSVGPSLQQFGYRLGCGKDVTDCYFTSVPVVDHCEASIYISNTEGELYSLSLHSPHFRWIQDFSSMEKGFTITPGNNGRLYVTAPIKALVLALDASSGNILWQKTVGPLSSPECAPVVDSNGWVSIGSLDGFLYSISPSGILKKFPKATTPDSVIQVDPILDCSGYAIYISQTLMQEKTSRTIGEYTYILAMKPRSVVFTLLVPATGYIYWTESYPDRFSFLLSEKEQQNIVLDEKIILAFITASKIGNPQQCRSTRQKLASNCYQARPKPISFYIASERTLLLLLVFESILLIVLAVLVRFCCIFWRKKKLQGQNLSSFFEKRRSLQLKKKAFDRTITELEQKAAEEAVANEVIEKLHNLVREREGIQRKLLTTYSLGRDHRAGSHSGSLLPLSNGKTRSYSFKGAKKESITLFHTLSDTSSEESSSNERDSSSPSDEDSELACKAKEKAPAEVSMSSSDNESLGKDYRRSPSEPASSSTWPVSPLSVEQSARGKKLLDHGEAAGFIPSNSRSAWLKRRRTMSSTN